MSANFWEVVLLRIGQMIRGVLWLYVVTGVIVTWRAADAIRWLPNNEQQSAFSEICREQKALLRDYAFLQDFTDGAFVSRIKFTNGSRIGVGLNREASTATIMREMFLGKEGFALVLHTLILFCLSVIPLCAAKYVPVSDAKVENLPLQK